MVNDTRVVPARLPLRVGDRDGELLLLEERRGPDIWEVLARPGRRLREGARVDLGGGVSASVLEELPGGGRIVRFSPAGRLPGLLATSGRVPLPPYIHRELRDSERYQTVFARQPGSAAAPTAGLHLTRGMLTRLRRDGVATARVTLRIGLDTFQPLREENLSAHRMHSEWFRVPRATAAAIAACRARGGRVVAVGTTTARALEASGGEPMEDRTALFIRPGYSWRVVDVLVTNFHLPRSSLLVMVSAFAGRERVLRAYRAAVGEGYRFYSFGDAMLLERRA